MTTPWMPRFPPTEALLERIRAPYSLDAQAHCRYLASGLHHAYLVTAGDTRRVCRVYRRAWRSHEAALSELNLLDQLARRGSPVAYPIASRDGRLAIEIDTDRGPTTVAMFTYAEGAAPGAAMTQAQAALLGDATARLHASMASTSTQHPRVSLDLAYLLDGSLDVLSAYLHPQDHTELATKAMLIREGAALPMLPPYFGPIHGDINLKNTHFTDSGLTFIDFDQCGLGWYAFEIGKFFHACSHVAGGKSLQHRFLAAYQAVRPLEPEALAAIPFFALLSHLWVMAIHAYNGEYLRGYLTDAFWERKMRGWRALLGDIVIT